jgi:hypothetical protein
MHRTILLAAAALAVTTTAAQAQSLAGRWSQQSSGQELVIRPKIKLTPAYSPSMGMSLGGSVGYGSATTTVLATEPTPLKVDRRMTLDVAADGGFLWTVVRSFAESERCTRTIRQEKRGRVTRAGASALFAVSGGTETSSNSCGGESHSTISASEERYTVSNTGAGFTLTGPSTRWTFTRG